METIWKFKRYDTKFRLLRSPEEKCRRTHGRTITLEEFMGINVRENEREVGEDERGERRVSGDRVGVESLWFWL